MTAFITRFAPSPTGLLHLGHAAAAFHVWDAAKTAGTRPILRIEDIDTTRCRQDYTDAIFQDLAWLGLSWPEPARVQSEHFADYARTVEALTARGLTYRCFRTRAELEHTHPAPLSPKEETQLLEAGNPFAWRLSLAAARNELGAAWDRLSYKLETGNGIIDTPADPALHGDIVIARKDSPSAYHLAACHDDALQGITHVIRGEDLIDAPHIHTLLQVLMGWPKPIYRHHPLVTDETGQRLSKTAKSVSLRAMRQTGVTPSELRKRLGFS